jgi:hypothetical protein
MRWLCLAGMIPVGLFGADGSIACEHSVTSMCTKRIFPQSAWEIPRSSIAPMVSYGKAKYEGLSNRLVPCEAIFKFCSLICIDGRRSKGGGDNDNDKDKNIAVYECWSTRQVLSVVFERVAHLGKSHAHPR